MARPVGKGAFETMPLLSLQDSLDSISRGRPGAVDIRCRRRRPPPGSVFFPLWAIGLLVFFLATQVRATELPYETVARHFLTYLNSGKAIDAIEILEGNDLAPDLPATTLGALVRLAGGGYCLIAASMELTPIKAYSLTREFEALPPPYRRYLLREMEANVRGVAALDRSRSTLDLSKNGMRWSFLLDDVPGRVPMAEATTAYLLKTQWNQDFPYNKFTPSVHGVPTYTGCVNTAMAQIMKYHRWPASGRGSSSYTWNGETLKAVYYKSYGWDDMPDRHTAATPSWQADQTASLLRDLGIANKTLFGTAASTASLNTQALIGHFGYSKFVTSRTNADPAAFLGDLKKEIDEGRPALLSFPEHMTVADGYVSDATGDKIHLNMGWGGTKDDYYYLDGTPVDYGQGAFSTQPGSLWLHYGIRPCREEYGDCNWTSSATAGPPVIYTVFTDRVLDSTGEPLRLYCDARDENGDPLSLSARSTNPQAVQVSVSSGLLALTPVAGAANVAGRVVVRAVAGGQEASTSFVTLVLGETVGFGKTFSLTGTFLYREQVDRHAVLLDGACTIRGNRGYSNQAFYTSVLDGDGKVVTTLDDETISSSFARGRYTILASLENAQTGSYYNLDAFNAYALHVSCPMRTMP